MCLALSKSTASFVNVFRWFFFSLFLGKFIGVCYVTPRFSLSNSFSNFSDFSSPSFWGSSLEYVLLLPIFLFQILFQISLENLVPLLHHCLLWTIPWWSLTNITFIVPAILCSVAISATILAISAKLILSYCHPFRCCSLICRRLRHWWSSCAPFCNIYSYLPAGGTIPACLPDFLAQHLSPRHIHLAVLLVPLQ